MDPFAHSFTGAALAATGLRKVTPLATAALLIGVNAPDVDAITHFMGDYLSLQYRRGWTHGILAWVVLPFMVTAVLLAWDRLVRQRRQPGSPPANARNLLLISTLGVLSHPALDWLNNYGIRLLMPFDDRWFYGDALFIIDPWVWLAMGGISFLVWSRSPVALVVWSLFWAASSWLVITHPLVPKGTGAIWVLALALIYFCRFGIPTQSRSSAERRVATTVVILVFAYMTANATSSFFARTQVTETLKHQGYETIEAVMVGPVPVDPFKGQVVVATPDSYLLGSWNWLDGERLSLRSVPVEKNLTHPAAVAASHNEYARRFLVWSRFPYAEITITESGYLVSFNDARYAGMNRGIKGPRVAVTLP